MRKGVKIAILAATGGVLALTCAAFVVLLVAYERGDDRHNEDAVRARAEAAVAADAVPEATARLRELVALNPFDETYREKYVHMLVRMRDYERLAAFTNATPVELRLTESELTIEQAIARGVGLVESNQNDRAIATFEAVTNLNYFAVTPFLIDACVRTRRLDKALSVSRPYLAKYRDPRLIQQVAEWAMFARRLDIVAEMREMAGDLPAHAANLIGYYCDALEAYVSDDRAALAQAMSVVGSEIRTPLARLLTLEVACDGDDPVPVEMQFQAMRAAASPVDLLPAARAAIRRFVAAHFPDRLPIVRLGRLADLADDESNPDLALLRISLLARQAQGLLRENELVAACARFPEDRGLKMIRRAYERARQ